MKTIKLLDLCCKAGGCSRGYELAAKELGYSIEITGVDIEFQPNYPYHFIQQDALTYLRENYQKYTHIHASPPCQKYSCSTAKMRRRGKNYPDILEPLRLLMYQTGKPGVIENVMQAPLRPDLLLTGTMFDLKVLRKRQFELVNWWCMRPFIPHHKGSVKDGDFVSVFGKGSNRQNRQDKIAKFHKGNVKDTWRYAMGIDWMDNQEMSEAIPPEYTKYIGLSFFRV
ncbi:class I SAM-dependent methyltransferase [Acetobacteroides hydrogenigenes]|uniref:DNA (Cytosine-5)-methyltransferase 1 n=1 Tax=Acetobacteroides hydrogenigenes TaxID=979970 RepID=A0A4V2RNH1_9BACT|nr:DNA cytosine methyltransferase [Acetobacteroides hydrogenigenes]TCN63700.1 DNA (cytosine-5)-methyltransferase 1 [Acetobacteroides hydrogenigenes]